MIPFFVVEENELGVVAGAIGVLDFDGLSDADWQDVRNKPAIDVIKNRLGVWGILQGRMDFFCGQIGRAHV